MSPSRSIVWLASYPRSGNTWMRIMLNALLAADAPHREPDINDLELTDHAGSRALVEAISACPSSELDHDELDRLRPAAFRALAARNPGLNFIKVHDAYRLLEQSEPLFPTEVSRRVIYVLRNPLDVVVSFAAHLGIGIDDTIALMADGFSLGGDTSTVGPQVRQQLGSWSDHVGSWTDQQAIVVDVVRYEDLITDAGVELSKLSDSLSIQVSQEAISKAKKAGSFGRLQAQEAMSGFREKSASHRGPFFRSGRAGAWREVLSSRQVERLVGHHEETMVRFGYLECL